MKKNLYEIADELNLELTNNPQTDLEAYNLLINAVVENCPSPKLCDEAINAFSKRKIKAEVDAMDELRQAFTKFFNAGLTFEIAAVCKECNRPDRPFIKDYGIDDKEELRWVTVRAKSLREFDFHFFQCD